MDAGKRPGDYGHDAAMLADIVSAEPCAPSAETPPLIDESVSADASPIEKGMIWDGRYRIEEIIGEGGMGNVLLASDLAYGARPIALKVLQPRFRESATAYLLREYSIQRLLRHPGIARAIDLGYDVREGDEVPYFTMPFVPGEPLTNLIGANRPLGPVWRWTIEILEALDAIHRAGYLHRDVKPGNILIDESATHGPAARLIDFGITIPISEDPEEFFIGTPTYSAPERIGDGPHDVRSDLYAVGLLLYEMIEGEPPWSATDINMLADLRTLPAPEVTRPGCPQGVRQLVADLLAPDPIKRPASAAVAIERLKAAVGVTKPLESAEAFEQRLGAINVVTPSYQRALDVEGEMVMLHVPEGHPAGEVLEEIGARNALRGARVVYVRLTGAAGPPLHELQGALDVFRRLRERDGNGAPLPGLAGAATMLTRLHRKTMLVVEGLEHADEGTLAVLLNAFKGAKNELLSVVASLTQSIPPKAARALAAVQRESFVKHVALDDLTRDETRAYVASVLGRNVVRPDVLDVLHDEAGGKPVRLRELLFEAFTSGVLTRRAEGYQWYVPSAAPRSVPNAARGRVAAGTAGGPRTTPRTELYDTDSSRLALAAPRSAPAPAASPVAVVADAAPKGAGPGTLAGPAVKAPAPIVPPRPVSTEAKAREARSKTAREPEAMRELRDRLSLLQTPFPVEAVKRFLGGADNYRRLIEGGILQATETLAVCAQRAPCKVRYAALKPERRHALHRQMAAALSELPPELGPASHVAEQLLLTERPASAAPWLVEAAQVERQEGNDERAAGRMAKAIALVMADDKRDEELAGWKMTVFGAALDDAERTGEDSALAVASERLLAVAIEVGDLAAAERAMRVRLDRAQRRWYASDAIDVIEEVSRLQESLGAKPSAALAAWAHAFEAAVRGDFDEVDEWSQRVLGETAVVDDNGVLDRWARHKTLALRAEIAVRGGSRREAVRALEAYVAAVDAEGEPKVMPAVLRSIWLRRVGHPSQARNELAPFESGPGVPTLRALVDLAIGECELALGRCEPAVMRATRALERARRDNDAVLVFWAEGLLCEAYARKGEPMRQLARLERALQNAPAEMLPQVRFEAKLRWLATALACGDGTSVVADAIALTNEAVAVRDGGAVARAGFLLAQAELAAGRPVEALRHAEWVQAIVRQSPIEGPPRHSIEWLLASVHYQLKWFKSANALSGRAMESLRTVAQSQVGQSDIEQWLRAGNGFLIGMQR